MNPQQRAVLARAIAWREAVVPVAPDPYTAALGKAIDALNKATDKTRPRTIEDLSRRAQHAIDVANAHVRGWTFSFNHAVQKRRNARLARLRTAPMVFALGRRAFNRLANVGPATLSELESVLAAHGYADQIEDWRAR